MRLRQIIILLATTFLAPSISAVNVSSISEYAKLADETDVTFTCKLTVVGHKGRKLFVTDGKDGAMLYGVFSNTYNCGDVFKEGLKAIKTTFDAAPELVKAEESTMVKIESGSKITPTKMEIGDISLDHAYSYVSVTGFYNVETSTLKSGKSKLLLFNIFGVQMPTDNGRETVNGILVYHKKRDIMQIYVM